MPNPSKETKCNDKATHENQTQSNDKKATMVKIEPVSNEIDRRLSDKETQSKNTDPDKLWLKIFNLSLKQKDKNIIINKDMLNDRIIDAAQIIMKTQFKHSPKYKNICIHVLNLNLLTQNISGLCKINPTRRALNLIP